MGTPALEFAPGTNATTGFRPGVAQPYMPDLASLAKGIPPTLPMPLLSWDASGLSGGPYTLRLRFTNPFTGEVSEGMRSVILDAPNYSPVATLDLPDFIAGRVTINGAVKDTDLAGWSLAYTGADGIWHPVQEGKQIGDLHVVWEAGMLADGPYAVRLQAWDLPGNVTEVVRHVQLHNPLPRVAMQVQSLEAVPTYLPLLYTAASPVQLRVTLHAVGEAAQVAVGQGTGDPGQDAPLRVPLDLTGVAPGSYEASVQLQDSAGRTGAFTLPVTVVAGVPRPVLGEVPPYVGRSVKLTWTEAAGVSLAHFDVMRTGPDGTPLLAAQVAAGDRSSFSYTDFPRVEGGYTYQIVAVATDGRRAEGAGRMTQVSFTPPHLPDLSISAVDGLGLQLQWAPAQGPVGIASYQVLLADTETPQVLAELPADSHSFRAVLPAGEHRAELVAVDRAGNRVASGPLAFRVDAAAVALLSHGHYAPADMPGLVDNGTTWVPLRFFADALGYSVLWNGVKQTASILDPHSSKLIIATVGEPALQVLDAGGARTIDLPGAPRNVGGRLLVPLRALAEALGAQVQWHADARTVEIIP